MHIERYGSGTQIYFGLHGWSGDHTTFAPLANRLPSEAMLYSVDLPGCGQSAAPRCWDLETLSDEIVSTVAAVATTPVTLIGNCSGALLGLLVAQRAPTLVQRLVLIDPFAYWPWYFKIFVLPVVGKFMYLSAFANPLGRWLTNVSLSKRRTEETDLTRSFSAVNHKVAHHYLALLTGIAGIEQFSHLQMPIDIVCGTKTFSAVKKSVGLWCGIWPQASYWELPGAAHLPLEEAPAEISEIVFTGRINLLLPSASTLHTEQTRETFAL